MRIASKLGNFSSTLGTLCLWVLKLFAMYATDGQTDRRTDRQKQRLLSLPYGRGHNKVNELFSVSVKTRRHPRIATTPFVYLLSQYTLDIRERWQAVLRSSRRTRTCVSGRSSCPGDVTLSHLPNDVIDCLGHALRALGHWNFVDWAVQSQRESPPLVWRHAPRMRRAVSLVGDEHERRTVVMVTQVPDWRQVGVEPQEGLVVRYWVQKDESVCPLDVCFQLNIIGLHSTIIVMLASWKLFIHLRIISDCRVKCTK